MKSLLLICGLTAALAHSHHHHQEHSKIKNKIKQQKGKLEMELTSPIVSQSASDLFSRLKSYWGSYILSGTTSDYYDNLKLFTGKSPAVRAFDFQNYSPHNPWHDDWSSWDDGTVQSAIDWYESTNGKGIVSFHWHWFSPMGGNLRTSTFYTQNTDFDVSKGVVSGTAEYTAIIRDIDAIAVQLKRLKDKNIPILWRPLHEAGGKWFWWGTKGSDACKKLYDIMRDRLINHHGLDNLIWIWSTPEQDWYPGNDKVDIIGYDNYPGSYQYDCNSSMFNHLGSITNWQKLIALSENGPLPDISNCFNNNSKWLYFLSWSSLVYEQNSQDHIKEVYYDSRVIHRDYM